MKYADTYRTLAKFGKDLLHYTSLGEGLPKIASYIKQTIRADRSTIYIYDSQKEILWTVLADKIDRLVIPSNDGIAGQTISRGEPIIVNTPYEDHDFDASVDYLTGYTTQNIATVPIFDSDKRVIGVLQLLNKYMGDFNEDDLKFMVFFAHYISGYLALSILLDGNYE